MIPVLSERPAISPSYQKFLLELKTHGFSGHIGQDYAERLTHSTDNSIYQVLPQAVIFPKTADDVACVLRLMNRPEFSEITLAARGGGTGTNGQALSRGLIMDLSTYMNKIVEINVEEGWVRVEPGVVLDQLNQELKPYGVFFAPDLSPSNRATLGGMVNTDACGKGSRIYGKTSQHVLELDLVLANGELWRSYPLTNSELEQVKLRTDRVGEIHRQLDQIVHEKMPLINERFPKLTRYLAGYNLKHIWDENGRFNLNYLIAGSEGTLACVTGLKLKLTPIPRHKKLVLVKYADFQESLVAARLLVDTDPAAIETIDDKILHLAKQDTIWHKVAKFFDAPEDEQVKAINLVEFVGDDAALIQEKTANLCQALQEKRGESGVGIGFRVADNEADIAALWSLRKKGVGLLGNRPGNRRPIPFVEDTVVPPEHLADYIAEFRALLDEFGLSYGMFGHVDVGCLHVRPALDLKQEQDEKLIRIISDRVKDLTLKYNGLIWGEHGKGFRGEYLPDFLGEDLHQALRQVKTVFDPENRLNPGKLVTPLQMQEGVERLDQVPLRAHADRQIPEDVRERFAVTINCNGNGACFNFQPKDVMCPSYKYTRSRIHSPKGRAGVMREWLRQLANHNYNVLAPVIANPQKAAEQYDFSHEVYEAMDGCLSCKACTTQCPVKVDIPSLKSKFLYHYHSRYKRPVSDQMLAVSERIHGKLMAWPFLYNFFARQGWFQNLLRKFFGMRDAPLLSSPNFYQLARKRGFSMIQPDKLPKLSPQLQQRGVILVTDGVTALYEAQTVIEIMEFLRNLGYEPFYTPLWENGKPLHVKGFLDQFQHIARQMNERLRQLNSLGLPMIGIDPAITLTYREEYRQELGTDHGGYQVLMPQEWLAAELAQGEMRWKKPPVTAAMQAQSYRFLAHCGEQTAQAAYAEQWRRIFQAFGLKLELEAVGCCGMAGAFGHEERHFEISRGIFELSWQGPLTKAAKDGAIVVATGASCRSQIQRLRKQSCFHPLQALSYLYR